ncbi:glycoside hydrolase [Saccharicrinis aurantiacus]|uniref:glycoside hydrolase n=1 Tax=Saccharicrinis aurantiacus TaxID=1849719 RepID=UPI00249154D5|nr:glycoside hydrolase [Saccharicrinis aurantiacus]
MRLFYLLFAVIMVHTSLVSAKKNDVISVSLNTDAELQTIHSWGASDAWRCQFVGKNWPIEKKEQIAEWLFSKELDTKGNPKGIGLSTWRFYLGAGSTEQADSSGIKNEWRRGECFLSPDGTFDWNKQQGQQWFLEKAKGYGVENFLAFMISPPVQYTSNGKAFSDKGTTQLNIKSGEISSFAKYMSDVVEYFNNEKNININYISPMNEPQWGWDSGSQEGSPASNEDLYLLTKYLSKELNDREIDCEIVLGESGMLEHLSDYAIESSDEVKRLRNVKERADQVNFFFNPECATYIGDLPHVKNTISGHSYFSTWPVQTLVDTRNRLNKTIQNINPDVSFWQSEYCVLEKNDDIGQGRKRDLGMGTALFVARIMHSDLVLANATSWQWWTALSQCDFKDGLIYLDTDGNFDSEKAKYDGTPLDSKLLWAFGNYSRFVQPGMKRIDVDYLSDSSDVEKSQDLMISAYQSNNQIVLVAINYTNASKSISIDGIDNIKDYTISAYETSEDKNLEHTKLKKLKPKLSGKSVTTIVMSK